MTIRHSEHIDVSWGDGYCQQCGEEYEDCECPDEDYIVDDGSYDQPEPEDDNEANWVGDTSEKNAY